MGYDSDGSYMHDENPLSIESSEGTIGLVHKLLVLAAALVAVVGTVVLVLTDMGITLDG